MYRQRQRVVYQNPFAYDLALLFIMSIVEIDITENDITENDTNKEKVPIKWNNELEAQRKKSRSLKKKYNESKNPDTLVLRKEDKNCPDFPISNHLALLLYVPKFLKSIQNTDCLTQSCSKCILFAK